MGMGKKSLFRELPTDVTMQICSYLAPSTKTIKSAPFLYQVFQERQGAEGAKTGVERVLLGERKEEKAEAKSMFFSSSHPQPPVKQWNMEAMNYYKEKEYMLAIESFEKILTHWESEKDKPNIRKTLYNLGSAEFKAGKFEKALIHLQQAKDVAEKICHETGEPLDIKYQIRFEECLKAQKNELRTTVSSSSLTL
jgi:tetratricopeptide (TPR) repeat protein